jgi:hypothetical protein
MTISTLNTNVLGNNAGELTLTTETIITLYVVPLTGDHRNHRVTLEFTPDNGTTWIAVGDSVNGTANSITCEIVANKVRACVCEVEGTASTIQAHILAR